MTLFGANEQAVGEVNEAFGGTVDVRNRLPNVLVLEARLWIRMRSCSGTARRAGGAMIRCISVILERKITSRGRETVASPVRAVGSFREDL